MRIWCTRVRSICVCGWERKGMMFRGGCSLALSPTEHPLTVSFSDERPPQARTMKMQPPHPDSDRSPTRPRSSCACHICHCSFPIFLSRQLRLSRDRLCRTSMLTNRGTTLCFLPAVRSLLSNYDLLHTPFAAPRCSCMIIWKAGGARRATLARLPRRSDKIRRGSCDKDCTSSAANREYKLRCSFLIWLAPQMSIMVDNFDLDLLLSDRRDPLDLKVKMLHH